MRHVRAVTLLLAVCLLVGVAGTAAGVPPNPAAIVGEIPLAGGEMVQLEPEANPLVVRVEITAGSGGTYLIHVGSALDPMILPLYLVDLRLYLGAPGTTPQAPNVISLTIGEDSLWGPSTADEADMPNAADGIGSRYFRIGNTDSYGRSVSVIPDCGEPGVASPDPCVLPPVRLPNGDIRVSWLATGSGGYEFTIVCAGLPATITGDEADNTINGTAGRDVIWAGAGDDVVRGKGGNDVLCLGAGADVGVGGSGKDRIYGQQGRDRLRGNGQRDKLFGGGGNDRLLGGPGNDILKGNRGNDTGDGGAGNDECRVENAFNCEA